MDSRVLPQDLDDPGHQEAILVRDKHTRLEGLCVEIVFEQELVAPAFAESTSGFWFTRRDGSYRVVKFLADPERFNALDDRVLTHLMRHGLPAWVVYFDRATGSFRRLRHAVGITAHHFADLSEPCPPIGTVPRIPPATTRDPARQAGAIGFLRQAGALREAAIERLFANCWIGGTAFWDIDRFAVHQGRLIAFEVKQKHPTRAGTFGLNTGLVGLFGMLHDAGIPVVHVVLTKPDPDIRTPALDLLLDERHRRHAHWLAALYTPALAATSTARAPRHTSIHGTGPLRYHHLHPGHFHDLGTIGRPTASLAGFLDGGTRPLRSLGELSG